MQRPGGTEIGTFWTQNLTAKAVKQENNAGQGEQERRVEVCRRQVIESACNWVRNLDSRLHLLGKQGRKLAQISLTFKL